MFRTLQKKLTFLYTITTGTILTVILIVCFFYMKTSVESRYQSQFSDLFFTISNRFRTETFFTDSWLSQMELDNKLLIRIEENGTALQFPGAFPAETDRNLLFEMAEKEAATDGVTLQAATSLSPLQSSVFQIKGAHNDTYLGIYLIETTVFHHKSLLVLQDVTSLSSQLTWQIFFFLLADLAGIFFLYLASWHTVGKTLLPLKENQKKQAEFIDAASHELRSPLAVIQASASAARTSPETTEQMLSNIEKECSRMGNLIKDLLVLAASDSKKWQLTIGNHDSDTLLLDVYETFEPVCRSKGMALHLTLPDMELPRIHCDKNRVIQILTILLDNAVTYTPSGGTIDLKVFIKKRKICYLVADHGKGIPDEEKERIFDRFYQSDRARKEKEHFGLGLSIARELAELQKGKLTVTDTEGGGCTFLLLIPATEESYTVSSTSAR